ncbi:MAG: creatininase family protein, partial [Chloroflexota bacterium]
WQELRRTEFKQLAEQDAVVIVPVGSTEQHGEHLPVNTDANNCFAIAQRAAERIDDFPVILLPTVWTGYSPHHMGHPGTITLSFHTFVEVLSEIACCVHAHGFSKVLFLNGHGGNSPVIDALRTKLAAEEDVSVVGYTYWDLPSVPEAWRSISETDKGDVGHAAEVETSMQLYLQPDLVARDAAKWVPGVNGDPRRATREKGERFVNAAVEGLERVLRDYHSGALEQSLEWRRDIA